MPLDLVDDAGGPSPYSRMELVPPQPVGKLIKTLLMDRFGLSIAEFSARTKVPVRRIADVVERNQDLNREFAAALREMYGSHLIDSIEQLQFVYRFFQKNGRRPDASEFPSREPS